MRNFVIITIAAITILSCNSQKHWTIEDLKSDEQALIDQMEIGINNAERKIKIDSITFKYHGEDDGKLIAIATMYGTQQHAVGYEYNNTKRLSIPKPFESKFMMQEDDKGQITWNQYDIVKNIPDW